MSTKRTPRVLAVSLTSLALTCGGMTAGAWADSGKGADQGSSHSQGGAGKGAPAGHPKAPPSHSNGKPGHEGAPGHQGAQGHQGNPGHQGVNGGNQGTPGGPASDAPQSPGGAGSTPGDGVNGDGHNPPGNNGTVKIEQLQADGVPQNNPHQSCQLRVEWYGFDAGEDVVSQLSFEAVAPTAGSAISVVGDTSVPVGGDAASGAGTDTGLDGSEVYTLSFTGPPHPLQGYHVKATVRTPYSLGNDSKSKVFWMEPCTGSGGSSASGADTGTGSDGGGGTQPGSGATGTTGTTGTTDASWSGGKLPATAPASLGGDGSVPVPTSIDAGGHRSEGAESALPLGLMALVAAGSVAAFRLRRRGQVG